ncbi:MAG: tRNA (adenosine(37)-N6)-threonylcarbamoyltransferase complex dimerization subunit type 1 TsaB [Bacteroidota bacterium]
MAKILSIESSTNVCSVAIHEDAQLIAAQNYHLDHSHSSLLPEIIRQLLNNCELTLEALDAIALSIGPGSYTGLRIGVSTAKGLAFVNKTPLIALDTLSVMCEGVDLESLPTDSLLCPMIDARRMEVYCRIQDTKRTTLWDTRPLIVEEDSLAEFNDSPVFIFGNGSDKCKPMLNTNNHHYIGNKFPQAQDMGDLAFIKFENQDFEDLAYLEPNYLKAFRTNKPAVKFKV